MNKFINLKVTAENIFLNIKVATQLILAATTFFVCTFSTAAFALSSNRTSVDITSSSKSKSTYTLKAPQDAHRKKIEALPEGKAIGIMTVSGNMELLNTNGDLITLRPGKIEIQIKNPNPILNPINYYNKNKFLEFSDEFGDVFSFIVPEDVLTSEFSNLINIKEARISNSLVTTISEEAKFFRSYDESSEIACAKPGFCKDCSKGLDGIYNCAPKYSDNCPGTKTVVNNMSSFLRELKIVIAGPLGLAVISSPRSIAVQKNNQVSSTDCQIR